MSKTRLGIINGLIIFIAAASLVYAGFTTHAQKTLIRKYQKELVELKSSEMSTLTIEGKEYLIIWKSNLPQSLTFEKTGKRQLEMKLVIQKAFETRFVSAICETGNASVFPSPGFDSFMVTYEGEQGREYVPNIPMAKVSKLETKTPWGNEEFFLRKLYVTHQ